MTSYFDDFPPNNPPAAFASWSEIPFEVLRAELVRRQQNPAKPPCGSRGPQAGYNTPLHVFALFLILVLSVGACSFPIIVRRFPRLPVPHYFLFLSRHFGTGVLIATAFVHLLPTAFQSLTDPCLPSFWNKGYTPMPGLIAMISVFVVVGIEMFFATRGAGHMHGSEFDSFPSGAHKHSHRQIHGHSGRTTKQERQGSFKRFRPQESGNRLGTSLDATENLDAVPAKDRIPPLGGTEDSLDGDESEIELGELGLSSADRDSTRLLSGDDSHKQYISDEDSVGNGSLRSRASSISGQQQQKKMLLQCLLLEAGILFHSVFIGMALSVAVGTPFIVLLIAISFHQTFEGLALGSRIAALAFPPGSARPWLMALAYGTTTPFGQAIGLAIHTLYDPASQTGLLTVGVMNAISSGLLLFAGLVELLAEDFLSDESYVTLAGRRRLEACASAVGGALLMALVGAWA